MSYYSCGINPPQYETASSFSPFAPPITEEELFSATTMPRTTTLPATALATMPATMPAIAPVPATADNIPEYLRRNIGYLARVEFLVGDMLVDKVGRIRQVGDTYVLLDTDCAGSMMGDLSGARFVTILGK